MLNLRAVLLLLLAVVGLCRPDGAAAAGDSVDLRNQICFAVTLAAGAESSRTLARRGFDCLGRPEGYQDRRLWLRFDDDVALRDLPAGSQLLIDQTRFDRLYIVVLHKDGTDQAITAGPAELARHWALGGHLRFTIDRPGRDIAAIHVGFDRLRHYPLMRKLRLMSPDAFDLLQDKWLLLIGLFIGAVGSCMLYNLFLYARLRYDFQRAYAFWALCILGYGLFWSNAVFLVAPTVAGNWGVRLNAILLAAACAAGTNFFLHFIEHGKLPPWLIRLGRISAAAMFAGGLVAAADPWLPVQATDRALNLLIILTLAVGALGIGIAAARGSRAVWFFLLGWFPPIFVLLLRLGRNFGIAPQNDVIDMATLAAAAIEAVLLSLANADRFRQLRTERDRAAEQERLAIAERELLRNLAETDQLTNLMNRRGFSRRVQAMFDESGTAPVSLLLLDADHFKAINDRYGHNVGDEILARIGAVLTEVCQTHNAVPARLGGEEFGIVVGGLSWPELLAFAEAARHAIAEMPVVDLLGPTSRVTVSVGVAEGASPSERSYERLYVVADRRLYAAKLKGRNRVVPSAQGGGPRPPLSLAG